MKHCLICGKEIPKKPRHSRMCYENVKFCSRECAGTSKKKEDTIANLSKKRRIERESKIGYGFASRNSTHPIYNTWKGMRHRCNRPKNPFYKNYGARGIFVCEEWNNDFHVFAKWAMDNGWEKGLTLDRINNNGNYEPQNCRWVSRTVQLRNKRTNIFLTCDGKTQTITDWANEIGVPLATLQKRIKLWGNCEKVILEPISVKHQENSNKRRK